MTVLAIIEFLLLVNMALFMVVFSLLAQPGGMIRAVIERLLLGRDASTPSDEVERMVRQMLRFYGMLGCGAVFGWAVLTGFVIALYREGFFRYL